MAFQQWALRWAMAAVVVTYVSAADQTVEVAPNVFMPVVLLGTGYMPPKNCTGHNCAAAWQEKIVQPLVEAWLASGARGIDTALMYNTQEGVAKAIEASGVDRKDIFILTKVPGVGNYSTVTAWLESDLKALQVGSGDPAPLDCVISHWCEGCTKELIQETWHALEDFYKAGKARCIGVSNYCPGNIETLLETATIKPHIHQFERSPYFKQDPITEFTVQHGIHVQGYAPLNDADRQSGVGPAAGALLADPAIVAIAQAHGMTPAQVVLRWAVQAGHTVTPRIGGLGHETPNQAHVMANRNVSFGLVATLTDVEMATIAAIPDKTKTWGVGVCKS